MPWDFRLGQDNTVWGSIGQGLAGVADAFANVQRRAQAADQQAFQDLQDKLKMFPTADDATKQQWIGEYETRRTKNKFWDPSSFAWPTAPATPGTPARTTQQVPPGRDTAGIIAPPSPGGGPFGTFGGGTDTSVPSAPRVVPTQMQDTNDPTGALSAGALPPAPAMPSAPQITTAPATPGTPGGYMIPGVSGANKPLADTYPSGTPTGDALRRVVPANLLTVPRDQLPPEVQSQVDEVVKRVTTSAFRTPVNLGDFVSGYRLRGGPETEPQARAFIKSLEDRVNDGSMTVSEAVAQVQKSPYFISPSVDQARFTTRKAGVQTRVQGIVNAALTAAKDGNLEEAKQLRDQAAQQLKIANDALASDAQNADQTFGGLSVQIPDDAMLQNAGAAHARTAARQDIAQGTQVGQILDKVRRGIPLTAGEQRVLNTVHPPRQPRAGTGPVDVTTIPTPGAGGTGGGASYRVVTKRDGSKQYQMSLDGKNFGDIPYSQYQAAVNIGKAPWQTITDASNQKHIVRVVPQPDGSTKAQENLGNGVVRNLSDDEARAILGVGRPTTAIPGVGPSSKPPSQKAYDLYNIYTSSGKKAIPLATWNSLSPAEKTWLKTEGVADPSQTLQPTR
jgi:hypothetical protein